MNANSPRAGDRVLSIDGGGVRGLIPALVLTEIERRTGRRTADLFDLIAGTSTGGILALGLTVRGRDGAPRWTAQDIVSMHEEYARVIFAADLRRELHSVGGIRHERYAVTGLERMLRDHLGEARLSEAATDVLVPAYDVIAQTPYFFRSEHARLNPEFDLPARVVARATSAAPTYFEPHALPEIDPFRGALLIDGGVYANNPAMCAFADAERGHLGRQVRLLSLGTGIATRELPRDALRHWGLAQWARPLLHVVIEGVSQAVDAQLDQLLTGDEYLRLQVRLLEGCDVLDDSSPRNLRGLRADAERLIAEHARAIDTFCGHLVA